MHFAMRRTDARLQRHFFNNLPTSFSLKAEEVDKLKAAGRQLLKANPDFQRLVRKLSAGAPL